MNLRSALFLLMNMGYMAAANNDNSLRLTEVASQLSGDGPDVLMEFWPGETKVWQIVDSQAEPVLLWIVRKQP